MFEISGQPAIVVFRLASFAEALPDDVVDGLFFQDNVNIMIFKKVQFNFFDLIIMGCNFF